MNNKEVWKNGIHAASLVMQALLTLSFYRPVNYEKMVFNMHSTNNQND